MRWERLFTDLETQFSDLADAELMSELPGRQREAAGGVSLVQRCRGSVGTAVRLRVIGGDAVVGELRDVGPDWILLRVAALGDLLVSLAAVTLIDGLTPATGTPLTIVDGRFTIRLALRRIARDRAPVTLSLTGGPTAGAQANTVTGTIDRVGADFIELAQHAAWEPRRAGSVRSSQLIPIGSIATVRAVPYV